MRQPRPLVVGIKLSTPKYLKVLPQVKSGSDRGGNYRQLSRSSARSRRELSSDKLVLLVAFLFGQGRIFLFRKAAEVNCRVTDGALRIVISLAEPGDGISRGPS